MIWLLFLSPNVCLFVCKLIMKTTTTKSFSNCHKFFARYFLLSIYSVSKQSNNLVLHISKDCHLCVSTNRILNDLIIFVIFTCICINVLYLAVWCFFLRHHKILRNYSSLVWYYSKLHCCFEFDICSNLVWLSRTCSLTSKTYLLTYLDFLYT